MVEISALKGTGITEAGTSGNSGGESRQRLFLQHLFRGAVEHALAHIEEAAVHDMPEEQQRWYAIKIFERDEKALEKLNIPKETFAHIEADIQAAEEELDDDAESIITNERYVYIALVDERIVTKKKRRSHCQLRTKLTRL